MLRAEPAMHAAPPASYKRKIQRAPRDGQPCSNANQRCTDDGHACGGNIVHPARVCNTQAVLVGKSAPEMFRINFDRTKSSEDTKAQTPLEGTSRQRSLVRIV